MVGVRSLAMATLMSDGIAASSWGSADFTASTVAMMLAPGWLNTMTRTAGTPLDSPALKMFSTPLVTFATSAR
jgi:hypothetical protein